MDVCKQEILPFLRDIDMQRRIANHFTQVDSVRRLTALLLEQSIGSASALVSSGQTRQTLRNHLRSTSTNLSPEADELSNIIVKSSEK